MTTNYPVPKAVNSPKNDRQTTSSEPGKAGSAAAIGGFLELGAMGLATLFLPQPYPEMALWLVLPGYALAFWVIVPASRRRYGIPFQRNR